MVATMFRNRIGGGGGGRGGGVEIKGGEGIFLFFVFPLFVFFS